MKSTWEEKARISEAHEADRKQLLKEQAEAQMKLNQHQENNWKLLEEKGDLGLTIGKVVEIFGAPGLVQSAIDVGIISSWSPDVRDILKLEEKLSEQDTVVQVYSTALNQDGRRLVAPRDRREPSFSEVSRASSTAILLF